MDGGPWCDSRFIFVPNLSYSQRLDITDLKAQLSKLSQLVQQIPIPNRILLHRLVHIGTRIMQFTEVNKMTPNNLVIVLCPSILYDKDPDPHVMVHDIQVPCCLVSYLFSGKSYAIVEFGWRLGRS